MEENGKVKDKGKFQRKIIDFLKTELASAIFFIIVGLLLALFPTATVYIICKVVFGLLLILTGLYNIFMYLSEKQETTVFNMLSGVIVLVLGLFLFNNPQVVVRLLHQLLGSLILIDSVWLLRLAYKMKKENEKYWNFCLIVGIICVVLGIVIVINPFAKVRTTVIFCGIVFLINGVLDVVIYSLFRKKGVSGKAGAAGAAVSTEVAVNTTPKEPSAWGEEKKSEFESEIHFGEDEIEEWKD